MGKGVELCPRDGELTEQREKGGEGSVLILSTELSAEVEEVLVGGQSLERREGSGRREAGGGRRGGGSVSWVGLA